MSIVKYMKPKTAIVLLTLVLVLFPVLKNDATHTKMAKELLKVGDAAPDFTVEKQDGTQFHLHDYLGKKNIVLYFYPRDESGGCTKEACSFRDNYDVFKTTGAEVVGINSQSVESHKKFAEHHHLPFILLSDKGSKVQQLYGVPNKYIFVTGRVTFVIDKQGVIRDVFSSLTDAEKHVTEALAILKGLN